MNSSGSINLTGQWNTLWGTIKGAVGNETLFLLLALAGVIIILSAVIQYVRGRRTGGGGGMRKLLPSFLLGLILAGPDAVIPLVLTILDWAANFLIAIFTNIFG